MSKMKNLLFLLLFLGIIGCSDDDISGSIYGTVSTEEGLVAANATMSLYKLERYNQDESEYGRWIVDQQKKTNDDGYYEFGNLSPVENYKLTAELKGYTIFSSSIGLLKSERMNIDISLEKANTNMIVNTLEVCCKGYKAFFYASVKFSSTEERYVPYEVGFIYGTDSKLVADSKEVTGTKSVTMFSATIDDLKKTTYYVQAYAKNDIGVEYGEILKFEPSGQPAVTTLLATNVSETTATLNGEIEYEGDVLYTERGFVYSSSFSKPTLEDPEDATVKVKVPGRNREFSANISGLVRGSEYSVRAYVINANGAEYGEVISLKIGDYAVILKEAGIAVQKLDISAGSINKKLAEELCAASIVGGYTDWRLPTLSELASMYNNKSLLPDIKADRYWSSTPAFYQHYYLINMDSGKIVNAREDASAEYTSYYHYYHYARCVRSIQ